MFRARRSASEPTEGSAPPPQRPAAEVEAAIEFRDVYKAFGSNQVLTGLTMTIPKGQITMIMGPSGTGKSVCVSHIIGLTRPDWGDVLVDGESIPRMREDTLFDLRKHKFGVLFQDGALFGSLNVFDNVAYPLRENTDRSEHEIREIVFRRLSEVGLADAAMLRPSELSGGMRKRVGFARALALDPDIVLFDEPDSGLDPVRCALLCELVRQIHDDHGGTYVMLTHDTLSARRIADHICVIWQGKLVEDGSKEKIFNSENPFVRQFLNGQARGPLAME
jgi:phospholipid/cholesterol/gamma-HCH transport system ATP-binding protein